jgi:hypothetical protein
MIMSAVSLATSAAAGAFGLVLLAAASQAQDAPAVDALRPFREGE